MCKKFKAAFIDRDGVINEDINYLYDIKDFIMLPGVPQALQGLRNEGYILILITNQAGIARGYYCESAVETLHEHMQSLLQENDAHFDAIYFCPHHPDGIVPEYTKVCECRKPSAGMLLQAADDLNLDLSQSILVGDKLSDIQAGNLAGLKCSALVRSGHYFSEADSSQATFVADDLLDAYIKVISY
jgi:D-glycero-D-manno-heptose 1,7-bisphosphate phosphatase